MGCCFCTGACLTGGGCAARRPTVATTLDCKTRRSGTKLTGTVAQMRAILERAEVFCAENGWDPTETPWGVGLISTAPPTEACLARGRELAERFGW